MMSETDRYHAALGSGARRQVLAFLAQSPEGVSAAALCVSLGLHITTVRFLLDQLQGGGLVTRRPAAEGRRGRPRFLYAATGAVRDEQSRAQMIQVLAHALTRQDEAAAASQNAGRQWAADFDAVRPQDPIPGLIDVLDRIGFDPELSEQQIRLHACPFRAAAREHPEVLCGVHRGLIDRLLEPTDVRARLRPFVGTDLCVVDLESSNSAMSR